jgi:cytochrome c oxidase subunit 2
VPAAIETHAQYQHVFDIYVPIGLGVVALFALAIVAAVVAYRRRPVQHVSRWSSHERLERGYAVLLVAVIAFLLYVTYSAEHRVDTVSAREQPQLVVDVTAAKWEWHFHYPAYAIDRYSGAVGSEQLVLPAGEAIRFRLASADVIHAFWIPALNYKHDAIPGSLQSFTLSFAHPGSFGGACAEFCGLKHSNMLFTARVLQSREFLAWAAAHRGDTGAQR